MAKSGTVSSRVPATRAMDAARADFTAAKNEAVAQFQRANRVEPLWKALTAATDQLVEHAVGNAGVSIVAVGGYGRAELYPFSDVDLLVLISAEHGALAEQASTQVLQRLWDAGLAASHATRTVQETVEAAQGDASIATALLDARLVAGDKTMFKLLIKRLKKEVFGAHASHYVATKLAERDLRHTKWGDSRFMLEPNIKDGKGALRDLQTLKWIADFSQDKRLLSVAEWRSHRAAVLFFATIRAHMHAIRNRADERLTFDLQLEIATRLKFSGRNAQQKAERLMRRYFQFTRSTGALTRSLVAALEEEKLRATPLSFSKKSEKIALSDDFVLEGGRLNFVSAGAPEKQVKLAAMLFATAAQHGIDIHPKAYLAIDRAMPMLTRQLQFEGEANKVFMQILMGKDPELHLRRMNECGVLGALIPEFERITGMMQYDGYHTYTVDEHMLVAVGNLTHIENGDWAEEMPISTSIAKDIEDRDALYLAVLCHDLAKGTGGGHAEKGEALMRRIAQRMGLSAESTALASWLVKNQELMTEFSFKRNLDDAKTIADFVAIVQSPERLRMLLLLTVSDIKAVGPQIWNGWKGALMRDLYWRALKAMGVAAQPTHEQTLSEEVAEVIAQWEKVPSKPALAIRHDRFRAITEILCCIGYTPTVFRTLAGTLAYLGASIVSARIQMTGDAALMHIGIQDLNGNSFADEEKRLAKLPEMIAKAEAGDLDLTTELPKRRKLEQKRDTGIAPGVFVDNQVSADASVIEVNARDRLGLLYDILGGMNACKLQVISAQLATYGNKAVDVFYVKNAYGHKVIHHAAVAEVQRELMSACAGEDA